MTEVVIVSACRTAVAKFQGTLAGFTAPQLGALAEADGQRQRARYAVRRVPRVLRAARARAGAGDEAGRAG